MKMYAYRCTSQVSRAQAASLVAKSSSMQVPQVPPSPCRELKFPCSMDAISFSLLIEQPEFRCGFKPMAVRKSHKEEGLPRGIHWVLGG